MNDIHKMKEKYSGKTLLFFDGSKLGVLAIEKAKSWGIRTVVANVYPMEKDAGKQVCDLPVDLDFSDVDAVEALIRREKIDGVMAGWTDSHLVKYAAICERVGFPAYGTREQFELFTQKSIYKKILDKYGIPTVEGYDVSDSFDRDVLENIRFPVLVKPSDGSGSRGIRVCNSIDELKSGYAYAKQFSKTGEVITERYLTGDEAVAFWFIQNGEAHLSAVGNWHKKHYYTGVNAMGVGYTFPSGYLKIYETEVAPKVKQMLSDIGIKNGAMFFQFFMDQGIPKVYDIGFRLTGTLENKIIDAINGYDPMERMIEFALSGKMGEDVSRKVNPHFGNEYGWNISFLAGPGRIADIQGVDEIKRSKGVIDAVLNHSIGDVIRDDQKGNLTQVVLRVLGHSISLDQMCGDMEHVYQKLKVLSDTGENMLLPFEDMHKYYPIIERKQLSQ